MSHAIIADLAGESLLDVRILDRPAAEERVRSGKVQVAAIIPKNFGAASMQALFSGMAKPRVELLIDPSQAISGRVVEGLFAQHGMREITKQAFGGASGQAPLGLQRGLSIPYGVETTKITSARNVPYNGYAHSFAGMTTQFILLAGIDAGIVLLLARERGIWQRLRSAPLSKTEFLLARTLATVLISLFQFMLIYAAAIVIFGVRIGGSIVGFAALAVALCLSERGVRADVGIDRAQRRRHPRHRRDGDAAVGDGRRRLGAVVRFSPMAAAGIAAAPTRWAVDGLDGATWRGQPLAAAIAPLSVLLATAVVCLGIAIWRFRWDEK